jgi:WD40 repeat protein
VPSKDEVAFLHAGVTEHQQQETVEQSRQRLLVIALSIFSVIVLLLGFVAEMGRQQADVQRQQAERQTQIANSRALAAQANYALVQNQLELALLLSVKANQTYNTYDARNSLLTALEYNPRVVRIIHFSAGSSILAFTSGGQEFASFDPSGAQGSVDKWDTKTGKQLSSQLFGAPNIANFPYTFYGLAVSPDGQMFAASAGEGLWVLNTKTDTQMIQLEGETRGDSDRDRSQVAFSPDGRTLASSHCSHFTRDSCTQNRILLWNVATKKPIGQMLTAQINGGDRSVIGMAFSYDGKMLASRDFDGTVQLWDIASRRLIRQFPGSPGDLTYEPTYPNEVIAFSPSGKRLALGNNDGTVALWDVTSGKLVGSPLGGHTGPVGYVAFSPDGTILATGSHDTTLQLWNVTKDYPIRLGQSLLGHTGPIASLAFSPDGKTLISSDGSTIIMWNMAADSTLNQKLEYTSSVTSAVFSSDGNVVIAGNSEGRIMLREAATGKLLDILDATMGSRPTFDPLNPFNVPLAIEGLALSTDGHILASGRSDGLILLWDMATRKPITHFSLGTHAQLQSLTFNPNGRILAATYSDGTVLLWDIATGQVLQHLMFKTANFPFLPVGSAGSVIAFSPDGKLLALSGENRAILWDINTGKQINRPFAEHPEGIVGVVFSPDGHTLATLDEKGTILLSDVETGKTIGQPLFQLDQDNSNGPGGGGIVFSPNGELLAAYNAGSVTLWDVTGGEFLVHPFLDERDAFGNPFPILSAMFSPNGQKLLVINNGFPVNSHITLWNLNRNWWLALACQIVNRNFTAAEWRRFAMGEPYRKVCPGLPGD